MTIAAAPRPPEPAASPGAAADLEGRQVRGQDGAVLGVVERVIPGRDGRPAQLLVRPRGPRAGGARSLAYGAVAAAGSHLSAHLTRAEFNAMPTVEVGPR